MGSILCDQTRRKGGASWSRITDNSYLADFSYCNGNSRLLIVAAFFDIVSRSKFSYRPAADRPRAEARYHSATVCSSLLHFVARCTLLHPVAPCQKCRK